MLLRPVPLRASLRLPIILIAVISVALLASGCSNEASPAATPQPTNTPAPEATPRPTNTPLPLPPTVTPTPTPAPRPEVNAGEAIIVGGEVRTRAEPSASSEQVGTIAEYERVTIVARVQGENWLVGSQTWVTVFPEWASEWFQLEDGSYVYGPFVFVLPEGEVSPLTPAPDGVERWIDVSLSEQRARAMIGDEVVYTARMSSGAPPFDTPTGTFAIEPDGRVPVERMTATQAGFQENQTRYDVERVLFTQYFDQQGNALHLNYWRPHGVFGNVPTSHGCIGLELHEAQYFWLFAEPGMRVEIRQ